MSHHPERTEKDCLNCGILVAGRYCQKCGQENVPGHMHFFALVKHFVFDIFHFDGKFFDTLRFLFFKPGYVPAQFILGRRMSYLDPIRMYIFTSAVFFLFFFAFAKPNAIAELNIDGIHELSKVERFNLAGQLKADSQYATDSARVQHLNIVLDTSYILVSASEEKYLPLKGDYPIQWVHEGKFMAARVKPNKTASDSLTSAQEVTKSIEERIDQYRQRFDGNDGAMISDFMNKLLHRFPYLLFFSLPFFAAILKLLYVRNKRLYYYDHAVFTLYHYVFTFILMLLVFGVSGLEDRTDWWIFNFINIVLFICWPLHLLFAMKRFYAQGWSHTVTKFLLLNILATFVMGLLAVIFIIYSVFTL